MAGHLLHRNLQCINDFIVSQRHLTMAKELSKDEEIQQITQDSTKAIVKDEELWDAFQNELKSNNVVTNASVKHVLHDFMTERQERLETLCKQRLRETFQREFSNSSFGTPDNGTTTSGIAGAKKPAQSWNEAVHDHAGMPMTSDGKVTDNTSSKSIMPKRSSMIGTAPNMLKDSVWSIPQQPKVPLLPDTLIEETSSDSEGDDVVDDNGLFVPFPTIRLSPSVQRLSSILSNEEDDDSLTAKYEGKMEKDVFICWPTPKLIHSTRTRPKTEHALTA